MIFHASESDLCIAFGTIVQQSDYQEHEMRHSNAKSKTAGGSNSKKKPSTSRRASSQHASSAAGHLHDDPHHVDDPTE